jgi:hypothetical protein
MVEEQQQSIPQLFFGEPIKQEAWHIQLKDKRLSGKRPIDKMSIAQILRMYEERKFLCDTCGKELVGKNVCSLKDHIAHLINPKVLWSCEDCLIDDFKNGRIIAATPDDDF